MSRRPNGSPRIPMRGVRVPDDLWEAVKERAAEQGETVSAVINRMLREYVARP